MGAIATIDFNCALINCERWFRNNSIGNGFRTRRSIRFNKCCTAEPGSYEGLHSLRSRLCSAAFAWRAPDAGKRAHDERRMVRRAPDSQSIQLFLGGPSGPCAYFIVGMTNSEPCLVPEGQRAVTVLVLV